MKKLFLISITFLFIVSLVNAQDISDLKKKIQSMNDETAQQMVSGDLSAMWAIYSEDVISMPSYEPMLRGIEACKQSYEKMNESGMKITSFKSIVTDIIDAGDYVVDIGTYQISMAVPEMEMPWNDHGKYMTIWEKQDDGALNIKVEMWNSDVNPWEEMQNMQTPAVHEGHQH